MSCNIVMIYVFLKSLRSPSPHTLYLFFRNAHHWSRSSSPHPKAVSFIGLRSMPGPDQWPMQVIGEEGPHNREPSTRAWMNTIWQRSWQRLSQCVGHDGKGLSSSGSFQMKSTKKRAKCYWPLPILIKFNTYWDYCEFKMCTILHL